MPENNEIVIYTTPDGKETFEVNLKKDTVWLDAHQLARLFKRDRSVIVRHINNVYNAKELDKKSTCAKIAQVAQDGKKRQMLIYNLDTIISIGYRVNSKRGTQFRIWATHILKEHLIKGYTINEKRMREDRAKLKEFQKTSRIMERLLQNKALDSTEATGLLKVILDYQKALHLLDEYDLHCPSLIFCG
jgi:hypothetical protein